ncbi:Uncharacterised protein [Mycobacteroides abscessus subsp. massiliense]|nr:Uncharacterised protein [Mycobacteroides abscessus subsp. massiliense]
MLMPTSEAFIASRDVVSVSMPIWSACASLSNKAANCASVVMA